MTDLVHVLAEDRDLAEQLDADRLDGAVQDCVARAVEFRAGDWPPRQEVVAELRSGLALLLLDGMLVRRVGVAGRVGSELLGEGDVIRPWQEEDVGLTTHSGGWKALRRGRMAVLDRDFALRAAPYPEVISALFGRAIRRSRYMAVTMAIMHQPRVDVRLHMLLWELAVRWGHVHTDGVHLPVRLTHSTLGELVAARRPTVTKALGELAERSVALWTGDYWLLTGRPPSELKAIHPVSVGSASGEVRAA